MNDYSKECDILYRDQLWHTYKFCMKKLEDPTRAREMANLTKVFVDFS